MFENLAKFPLLRARRPAPRPQHAVSANDNRPDLGQPNRRSRRPVMVCRWTLDQSQGLTSHWDIEAAPEPNPPRAEEPPSGLRIHTTVFVLSYHGQAARSAQRRAGADLGGDAVASASLADTNRARSTEPRLQLQVTRNYDRNDFNELKRPACWK
jgi:hypothetical protein